MCGNAQHKTVEYLYFRNYGICMLGFHHDRILRLVAVRKLCYKVFLFRYTEPIVPDFMLVSSVTSDNCDIRILLPMIDRLLNINAVSLCDISF